MAIIPPSILAAFQQANTLWPARSKASDGSIGDPAHASRLSDHNPDARGIVHAFDLTHHPAAGVDCHRLSDQLRQRTNSGAEPRVKYVIWNRRIYNPLVANDWRPYTGSNPHDKHMHVSIRSGLVYERDTSPWWVAATATPPTPRRPPDMVLAYKQGSPAVYLFFGKGNCVPIEDPVDRDVLVAKGVPGPIELGADAWSKWGGPA